MNISIDSLRYSVTSISHDPEGMLLINDEEAGSEILHTNQIQRTLDILRPELFIIYPKFNITNIEPYE